MLYIIKQGSIIKNILEVKQMEKISIVVPCYNEENNVNRFYDELKKVVEQLAYKYEYEIVLVNDGSKDKTEPIIKELRERDNNIKLISFSRNFGKEAAIYAGLNAATGEFVVLMDADLQHPPSIILEMVEEMENGSYDVVATKRKNRKGEPVIRSLFSKMFYKLIKLFVPMEENVQDFRIMKKEVVEAVLSLNEYNRFSKGIFTWVGFKTKYILIENVDRTEGKSKWNFFKLVKYAVEGITSFTTAPLKLSIVFGFIISILAIISTIVIVFKTLLEGIDVPGYASTFTAILFIGGIQLISIGILSEYISKMYLEIKNRPKYIIKKEESNWEE